MCWVVIFRVSWGLIFRVNVRVGGSSWYLGARSDMRPVWQSMKTYGGGGAEIEMQGKPTPPLKALMPWHSVRNFSARKCFVFPNINDQKGKHRTKKPTTHYTLEAFKNRSGVCGCEGQTRSQLKPLLRDIMRRTLYTLQWRVSVCSYFKPTSNCTFSVLGCGIRYYSAEA